LRSRDYATQIYCTYRDGFLIDRVAVFATTTPNMTSPSAGTTTALRTGSLPRGLALLATLCSFDAIRADFFALVTVPFGCSFRVF
jgi:hypothetical protein